MNIIYIYTHILSCSTSIWHLSSRGTIYMQSKWLFRWKISAIAFYLRRLGFKPLIRSQVKISLVLLSYLAFVHFTQFLLIQVPFDVTRSPCSEGDPRLQRRRILSFRDSCIHINFEEKECKRKVKKREREKRTQGSSIVFYFSIKSHFLSTTPSSPYIFWSDNKYNEI